MRAPVISAKVWVWARPRCLPVWAAQVVGAAQAVRAAALPVRLPALRRAQQAVLGRVVRARVVPVQAVRVADAAVGIS